jgi:magnesium transporter
LIEELGRHLDLHPLLLEDIVHTRQRPKLEDFETYTYVVARMLYQRSAADDDGEIEIESEQVSMVVGPGWVLTFLEDPGDVFDPVRRRLRENKGRLRKLGADYLAYSLLDVVVDNYFAVLERLGEEVDRVEGELLGGTAEAHLEEIRALKRAMIQMRGAVWPLRDVIAGLLRGESKLFKQTTLLYLRDVHDHVVRVAEIGEALRETVAGMMDIYLSSVSNRLNQVMKVLTIIATIFIPLTFIVGVYGMNFDHMPELAWRWGYWVVWGVMVVIAGALLGYFRRKRWF